MVWVLLIGYSVALVARSMFENYAMNRQIAVATERINRLGETKRQEELMLVYFRSPAFIEVEARRRLNLRGAGEHVVVLSESGRTTQTLVPGTAAVATPAPLKPWQTWWNLFFENKKTP